MKELQVGDRVKWRDSHFDLRKWKPSREYWSFGTISKIDRRRKRSLIIMPDKWAKLERKCHIRLSPSEVTLKP